MYLSQVMYRKYQTLFRKNEIDSKLRVAHFMAQIEHESGLKPIEENLRYSAVRLTQVFPKYFPILEIAQQYAMKPIEIANKVYANRMENGSPESGDGWRFRGRGFIQLTGRRMYRLLSRDTGIDYLNNPDSLLNEVDAMVSAVWYWKSNNLNRYADKDDLNAVTRAINGGLNGLADRRRLLVKWKKILWNE